MIFPPLKWLLQPIMKLYVNSYLIFLKTLTLLFGQRNWKKCFDLFIFYTKVTQSLYVCLYICNLLPWKRLDPLSKNLWKASLDPEQVFCIRDFFKRRRKNVLIVI